MLFGLCAVTRAVTSLQFISLSSRYPAVVNGAITDLHLVFGGPPKHRIGPDRTGSDRIGPDRTFYDIEL